ncbi:hypothetical protein C8Q76DRAFT_796661 [Earliella scabrosa]|nr:hypothetical protein C8Q76DRAFT_796661 [Earliella scabrosa]
MKTRETNREKHPGLPDLPRWNPDDPDRPPTPPAAHRAKTAAAKQAEADAKEAADKKRADAIRRAAQLQNKNSQVDAAADELRRHPPRPRPLAAKKASGHLLPIAPEDSAPKAQSQDRHGSAGAIDGSLDGDLGQRPTNVENAFDLPFTLTREHPVHSDSNAMDVSTSDPGGVDGESEDSGSNFELDSKAGDESIEDDGDEDMDVDEEDVPKKKHGPKRRIQRVDVLATRAEEANASAPKRKDPPTTEEPFTIDEFTN